MYTDRYSPRRFAQSRKRRRQHRIKIAILVFVAIAVLSTAAWLLFRPKGEGAADAAVSPAASAHAGPSATPDATVTPTPTATPTPSPTSTPTVAAAKAAASFPPGLIVNKAGATIGERFLPPAGYERVEAPAGSFGAYLQALGLKPDGAKVEYYNGGVKDDASYLAVVDMDIGKDNLLQYADAAIKLNAEYRYSTGQQDKIAYHFVSGFLFEWDKWRQGNRIHVDFSKVTWVKSGPVDSSEAIFQSYLDTLYHYTATRSLAKFDLVSVLPRDMQIGDLFVEGTGSGHVALVADMAVNAAGKKCFLLLQGDVPAQDLHILRNPQDGKISPWIVLPDQPAGAFQTPEHRFTWEQLMRFKG